MTYSTLKKISVASVAATMFMGTMAVSREEPPKSPFDRSTPCPPLGPGFGPGFTCPASAKDPCLILPEFNFIGVDDQGVNNSQFFKMNLTVPENSPNFLENFGELYQRYDIEALDSTDPTKNLLHDGSPWSCLFAASGDNDGGNSLCKTGCFYSLNKSNGRLDLMGDICTTDKDLEEIDALAFRPEEGGEIIWGWSRSDGLFKIETFEPESGLCGDGREAVRAQMICDIPNLVVEDMTWIEKEAVFYAYVANEKAIYKFNPDASCDNYEKVCTSPHEIEALEYMEYISPDGLLVDLLVMGYDAAGNPVAALDLKGLNPIPTPVEECNLLDSMFPTGMDVEGIAYP
jgi:hypothetical protein